MSELDRDPALRTRMLGLGMVMAFGVAFVMAMGTYRAQAQDAPAKQEAGTTTTTANVTPSENLTVLGRRKKFETAPMPGAPMPPPPDKPGPHLGRYKISGDQSQKDGYDAQTGAYIAPFGSAYTNASPTADGLASRFQH